MPNKKAQRNNNRKTKRAPPKQGRRVTDLDKYINLLSTMRADCANPTCHLCKQIYSMISSIKHTQKLGATTIKSLECTDPNCDRNCDTFIFNMQQYLGIRPNGRVGQINVVADRGQTSLMAA